jgi:hypothetical protein
MIIISHRRNTIQELQDTPTCYGIEVDIRSYGNKLIIQHEPFMPGEDFVNWLNFYQHKTLILNVKEEGLEERLIALMQSRQITDYFFLDQSFPYLIKWSNLGEKNCAVRVSEYEAIQTALSLKSKINWVWVDCFTKFPLEAEDALKLRQAGFKLCLVSPELQGRHAAQEIYQLQHILKERNIIVDAVCTKRMDLWQNMCNI